MVKEKIVCKGARVHNLKNINVEIPRDKLVVITGVSGSGKSSLAFDTIYAEGQRKYVESLSSYARRFLERMDKPDVAEISGLSPAISIEQRTASKNPRSTVGTVTEIYDYLRLLFARIGIPHCYQCGQEISRQTTDQIVEQILNLPDKTRILVLAPMIRGRKGEHKTIFKNLRKNGFVRARINGSIYELDELEKSLTLDKNKKHTIEAVVDRLIINQDIRKRLADSVETTVAQSGDLVIIHIVNENQGSDLVYSLEMACPACGISYEELDPRSFSFNSPYGACPACGGLGDQRKIDPDLVIPDKRLSIYEGGIRGPWGHTGSYYMGMLEETAMHFGFGEKLSRPVAELTEEELNIILYGSRGKVIDFKFYSDNSRWEFSRPYEGVINNFERRYLETKSDYIRTSIERLMSSQLCPECNGRRLRPETLAVTVGGKNIYEITEMSALEAKLFFDGLTLSEREEQIARQILKEIRERLTFLYDVGVGYLTLNRSARTLSGGEAQRIRLATQIGSSLCGVLYVLDEPSVGLHQRDKNRLISTLYRLRDLGNTVLVVEHDASMIRGSDYVIDLGPGAGIHGGEVVATGTPQEIAGNERSITGRYLSGNEIIPIPDKRRNGDGTYLLIKGAKENNLKNIDVKIWLGLLTCVTGVSGSGKSTLINEICAKGLKRRLYKSSAKPGVHDDILGTENIDKAIVVDQSPIGRTPRSNPATYTNIFTPIRELFTKIPEARIRGYKPGRFSFNVRGGRCEACRGGGTVRIEMHFLPDVFVTCDVCKGLRYNRETLDIRYREKNIHDVLAMTVEEALKFFENIPPIREKLQTLFDVGLGYIQLGQPAPTLSGGEAQRVKLAKELGKRSTEKTLYILDEPTTGLADADVKNLLAVLHRLVDAGNTVVIIEHHLDVIKSADQIIDLGPEGGDEGGRVVAIGTPEEVAQSPSSYTAKFLKEVLNGEGTIVATDKHAVVKTTPNPKN
ncbi:MAG: excinuclease ABC subunit UvrA [Candidatus Heimdallarchaeota archaeon]